MYTKSLTGSAGFTTKGMQCKMHQRHLPLEAGQPKGNEWKK